jgi:hypothetical protein
MPEEAPAKTHSSANRTPTPIHDRHRRAERLVAVAEAEQSGQSQREAAQTTGVARSTLRHWKKTEADQARTGLARFAETPEGVAWLRRIESAAHWCIGERAGAGIRVIVEFLELSGLSAFIASSYGAQQAVHVAFEEQLLACAGEQREKLSEGMPHRRLSLSEDETWKDGLRLVGIDPVSGFIVVEQASADRSAQTWTQALGQGLAGLNVTVVQATSDEAKGLLAHVQRDLGAHHTTDLFHLQHEISQATSLALARAERQADTERAQAEAHLEAERAAERAYRSQTHGPGRPPNFAMRIQGALRQAVEATRWHQQARAHRTEAKAILNALSEVVHPYDLDHAQAQSPQHLSEALDGLFQRLESLTQEAHLSERLRAHVVKAQRLTHKLVASLAFFFMMVNTRVQALNLAPAIEQAMLEHLIPAIYIERVAERAPRAEQRQHLRTLSAQCLAPLQQPSHPIQTLDLDTRTHLEQVAGDCADLFQRTSSCVEGRNAQLAFYQQGHHRLSARQQQVLTALHNFATHRSDGSTPAERFFGQPHPPLFEQVLERMPWPARPARRRPRPAKRPYLMPVAA